MDGANSGISVGEGGALRLQSRGHFLTGGAREKHFDLFKRWAGAHAAALTAALGQRYVAYGEWLYAKHTIFYDRLPHYWMEFDVLDRERGVFLDTPSRQALLAGLPLVPVRVLHAGPMERVEQLQALLGPSAFIRPGHLQRLREACQRRGLTSCCFTVMTWTTLVWIRGRAARGPATLWSANERPERPSTKR